MNLTDIIKETIASSFTDYMQVEIVKLSYSAWDEPIVITNQLPDGTQIKTSEGDYFTINVPMKLTNESQDELVSNSRSLTIQGVNDLIAQYQDLIDYNSEERILATIYSAVADRNLNVSEPHYSFKYYVMGVSASQKSNSTTLSLSTAPTNKSETGVKFNSVNFPSMKGLE